MSMDTIEKEYGYRVASCCFVCQHVNWKYEEVAEEPCEVLNKLVFRACVCDKFLPHTEEYIKDNILPVYICA